MTDIEPTICNHCGQQIKPHKYTLTKSLSLALKKIAGTGNRKFNSKDLRDRNLISSSDYTNITHLRYLGMVQMIFEESGERGEGRLWRITEKGIRYLNGDRAAKWVIVYNKNIVETAEETITISEADGYYQPPPYWQDQYRKLNDNQHEMEF